MEGLTLDTGALVALERRKRRAFALVEAAIERGRPVTVPAPVLVEWWRGQRGHAARLLEVFVVEPLGRQLAHTAGLALVRAGNGPSGTDAVVMASAAQRGDVVLSGDLEGLSRLQVMFPAVRLLRV